MAQPRYLALAQVALLAALALVLSYLETMIPLPVAVPGIKLGLANAAVLVALYVLGWRSAAGVAAVKVIAAGMLFGSPTMLAYSFCGMCFAFLAMAALKQVPGLGVVAVSMVSAVCHNVGQLLAAAVLLGSWSVFATLPLLALAACVTGSLIGAVAQGVLCALETGDGGRTPVEAAGIAPAPGELVAFIGPNGSGKTTAALQLAGLLGGGQGVATAGSACLVFQNPDDQIVAERVGDDVAFGLENRGTPLDEMRAAVGRALSSAGIPGSEDAQVEELSGGQRQKVAIAGALVCGPRTLVFDEASAQLDPAAREGFTELLRELAERGLGVVDITQDLDEAFRADRIAVFSAGVVVAQGAPDELLGQSALLEELGLGLPSVGALAVELRSRGVAVPLTNDYHELEEALWRSHARG